MKDRHTAIRQLRTVARAEEIIREEGATDWIGLDEGHLGCTVAEHEAWFTTCTEGELRDWARSVVADAR